MDVEKWRADTNYMLANRFCVMADRLCSDDETMSAAAADDINEFAEVVEGMIAAFGLDSAFNAPYRDEVMHSATLLAHLVTKSRYDGPYAEMLHEDIEKVLHDMRTL